MIGIMLDTKGPEIRTGKLEGGAEVELVTGQAFTLVTDMTHIGSNKSVAVDYKNITKVLTKGARILIDDGLIALDATHIEDDRIECTVLNSGMLGEKKGVNLPGATVDLPALMDKDIADVKFGIEQSVDFVAQSFVRKAQDVLDLRKVFGTRGRAIKIIAKIESHGTCSHLEQHLLTLFHCGGRTPASFHTHNATCTHTVTRGHREL